MSLKDEIAGAIREIWSIRGVDYGNLADVIAKSSVGNLEQGKHSITLEKLIELSNSLQFDPVALLAL